MKSHVFLMAAAAVLALAASGASGAAKLYKWVDEKGQVHYSQSMPPEYKDSRSTELDRRGRVLRQIEAVPPVDQARLREEDMARRKLEEKRVYEQRRRDNALMNTYTTEAEIDTARDRNLALPNQAVKGIEPRLKDAWARLEALKTQADGQAKAGKTVSEGLKEDIAIQEREVAQFEAELRAKQTEVTHIRERYDTDKARFRELSSVAANKQ
ncbi:MAG: DUF4124 domain-containing protein [Betaproteobacteria bacterium]